MEKLVWADLLVIAAYFLVTIGIGVWTIIKTKGTIDGVFLAGRSITWWPIGLSIFASNIGSINFIGIAGTAAASGVAVIHHEWNAVPLQILLGWVFLPVNITSGIYTIPEYLQKRFGGQRLRIYLSVIALMTYLFAILSVDLYSGALFMEQTLGWNLYVAVVALLAITFLFTGLGGLRTVILTDAIAVCVMVGGGFVLFVVGMVKIGGFSNLKREYVAAFPNVTIPNTTCGDPRHDSWHTFRHIGHADYPWLGTLSRSTFGALWFFCANQLIVQRALAAKSLTHAKAGCILAGFIKLTPMVIIVLPGMISRALFPDEMACATPERCLEVCGNPQSCSNIAYPKLVTELLPQGLRGLLIASMIAAVVSSLTSIFNSSSALVTIDLWNKLRPKASELELLIVGKLFIVVLVVFAIVWIPVIEEAEGGMIYKYAITANGYFGGPTCAMFLIAIFWRQMTEPGAFYGMITGQLWGMVRFVLDLVYKKPVCGALDNRPAFIAHVHPFYHITSQMLLTASVSVVISFLTKPIPADRLAGVTYFTRNQIPHDIREKHDVKKSEDEQSELNLMVAETNMTSCELSVDEEGKKTSFTEEVAVNEGGKTKWKEVLLSLVGLSDVSSTETFSETRTLGDYETRLKSCDETRAARIGLNTAAGVLMSILIALYVYFF